MWNGCHAKNPLKAPKGLEWTDGINKHLGMFVCNRTISLLSGIYHGARHGGSPFT